MHPRKFESLYLCLKAGNEIDLMPRRKDGQPIRIVRASKSFEKEDKNHGIKIKVLSADGQWIQLIAGDVLKQPAKHGGTWEV